MQGMMFCGDVVAMNGSFAIDKALQEKLRSNISFCNLEAPILPKTGGGGVTPTLKAGPSLHTHDETISDLVAADFSGFMLANNHIADYGEAGIDASIEQILKSKAVYAGVKTTKHSKNPTLFYTINDTKIALVNAAESQFGTLDSSSAFLGAGYGYADCFDWGFITHLQALKKEVDVVIAVIHAGLENVAQPLPQFRELYKMFCDMGADCIIAHHPHIIQGYEDYHTKDGRESRIFYSLGNFFFSYNRPITDPLELQGLSVVLRFDKGKIASYELVFSQQIGESVGELDSSGLCVSIESLNAILCDKSAYKQAIMEIITQAYPQYMKYYEYVFLLSSRDNSWLTNIKLFIKSLFFPHRYLEPRQALLLHNINIPTHRFVQELYLKYALYHKS